MRTMGPTAPQRADPAAARCNCPRAKRTDYRRGVPLSDGTHRVLSTCRSCGATLVQTFPPEWDGWLYVWRDGGAVRVQL